MKRFFERVSYEQFHKDTNLDKDVYNSIKLPRRATRKSSGYDFYAYSKIKLMPGEEIKYPTGIKTAMPEDNWLKILVRSGAGFKYNIRLKNQVGNIDADYYNNSGNEGHIYIALKNEGGVLWVVEKGDAYAQGVFSPYFITDDDNPIGGERVGGFSSTSSKKR